MYQSQSQRCDCQHIQLVPSIIATHHQETLAIHWMLEAAAK
jgi:hypothetical protein